MPQYRQLFDDIIPIAETVNDFHDKILYFLKEENFNERKKIIAEGYRRVMKGILIFSEPKNFRMHYSKVVKKILINTINFYLRLVLTLLSY